MPISCQLNNCLLITLDLFIYFIMALTSPLTNPIETQFKTLTRYHIYFLAIFFTTKFMSVWHTLNIIFLSPPMSYTCGADKILNECPCRDPVWDYSVFTKTVQTKFGILCYDAYLISLSESTSFFGLLVGALTFGVLSDRFGRLMMYAICQLIIGSAGCLVSVMPTMLLFIIARFFEGIGSGGAIVTGYVLCVEFCGTGYRATISTLLHFPANLGLMALAGISYLLRDCDHFQLAVSVPVLLFFFIKWLLLESPKWLLDNNKIEEAVTVMEKICRFNKTPCETIRADMEAFVASRSGTKIEQMKFYHIFKYRRHCINFCCMAYLYFVCGMCYYGISQFIGKMSLQVHQNTVFNGVLLLSGTLSTVFLINRVGRRPYIRTTLFLAGIFMITVVVMGKKFEPAWVRIMFACLSSACYYVSFIIVFLLGVELFPTNIRSSTLGILSLVSRVGQVLGPIINSFSPTVAGSVFASTAIIGTIVTFFLPETKGIELPSILEEGIDMHNNNTRVRFREVPK